LTWLTKTKGLWSGLGGRGDFAFFSGTRVEAGRRAITRASTAGEKTIGDGALPRVRRRIPAARPARWAEGLRGAGVSSGTGLGGGPAGITPLRGYHCQAR